MMTARLCKRDPQHRTYQLADSDDVAYATLQSSFKMPIAIARCFMRRTVHGEISVRYWPSRKNRSSSAIGKSRCRIDLFGRNKPRRIRRCNVGIEIPPR